MTTALVIFNILGWLLAGLFLALALHIRSANQEWRERHEERSRAFSDLKHQHMVREMDQQQMKWLSEECTRLSLKCAAICAQIRKMKGRGKSGVNPIHHF